MRPRDWLPSPAGTITVAVAVAVGVTGCGGSSDPPTTSMSSTPPASSSSVSSSASSSRSSTATTTGGYGEGDVATGLDVPWDIEPLPDGRLLISLRDKAEIVAISADGQRSSIGTVPGVVPEGEGGLLGLAASPDFASSGRLYAYFTAAEDNRVVACTVTETSISACRPVLTGIAKAGNHNGGRIDFGPDGALYVGTGDAGDPDSSQDRQSLNGKILRLDVAGGGEPEVFSMGHRNVQGLGWLPDGTMVAAEFGQNTWDELNVITQGGNYGWPAQEGRTGADGFIDPVAQWSTDQASPSGLAVAGDGTVYLAALRGESVWQIRFDGDRVDGAPRRLFHQDYGRIRDIETVGEGSGLLIISNNTARGNPRDGDDRLVRVDAP